MSDRANVYQVARERGWVQLDAYDWRPPRGYEGPHCDRGYVDYKTMVAYIESVGYYRHDPLYDMDDDDE